MRRFAQIVCLILVLSTVLVSPAFATESTTWESNYFSSRLAYLHQTTGTQFQVWIEVVALGTMEELGASEIIVQRSSDDENWTDMKTYTKEEYTNMVASNAFVHKDYVTYTGTSKNYYRAKVLFYAKKGNGTAEYSYTTESLYIS